MDDVCALVLTRNRKALLFECLSGLRRMTVPATRIVIVDNASSDGTEDALRAEGVLDQPDVVYVRLEENTGSAGGYSKGIEVAREQPVDWIWIMDDDAEPEPEALERLLASPYAREERTAALASAVVVPSGDVDVLHRGRIRRFLRELPASEYLPGNHVALGYCSFTGMMVRAEVARAEDPPRADFFIWFDDVEYSIRLRRHGEIRLVPESRMGHKFQMGGTADTRRSRFWNRLLGTSYTSNDWADYWKNLNGIRNFMWVKHTYGNPGLPEFGFLLGGYVVKTLMFEPRPFRRIPWIVRASLAGRRGQPLGLTAERWAQIS
jgi:GT2 family glycosyltransferase